jgi:hypothetical protein
MRINYPILLTLFLIITPSIHAMEEKRASIESTGISCDIDGLLSENIFLARSCISDLNALRRQCPLVDSVLSHEESTYDRFVEESKADEPWLIIPVLPVFEVISQLQRKGYHIVANTNQAFEGHVIYREKMLEQHNIDLNRLFATTLTTNISRQFRPLHLRLLQHIGAQSLYDWWTGQCSLYSCHDEANNIYRMTDPGVAKPSITYYDAATHLIQKKKPNITKIIHIDDLAENVDGANDADMHGIHFNIKVLRADPAALKAAITKLKEDLKAHGIECD